MATTTTKPAGKKPTAKAKQAGFSRPPAWMFVVLGVALAIVVIALLIWWLRPKEADSTEPTSMATSSVQEEKIAKIEAKLAELEKKSAVSQSTKEPTAPATPAAPAPAPNKPEVETTSAPGQSSADEPTSETKVSSEPAKESVRQDTTTQNVTVGNTVNGDGDSVVVSETRTASFRGENGVKVAPDVVQFLWGTSTDTVDRKVAESQRDEAKARAQELKAELDSAEAEVNRLQKEREAFEKAKAEADAKAEAVEGYRNTVPLVYHEFDKMVAAQQKAEKASLQLTQKIEGMSDSLASATETLDKLRGDYATALKQIKATGEAPQAVQAVNAPVCTPPSRFGRR